jgi:hypothetical protein
MVAGSEHKGPPRLSRVTSSWDEEVRELLLVDMDEDDLRRHPEQVAERMKEAKKVMETLAAMDSIKQLHSLETVKRRRALEIEIQNMEELRSLHVEKERKELEVAIAEADKKIREHKLYASIPEIVAQAQEEFDAWERRLQRRARRYARLRVGTVQVEIQGRLEALQSEILGRIESTASGLRREFHGALWKSMRQRPTKPSPEEYRERKVRRMKVRMDDGEAYFDALQERKEKLRSKLRAQGVEEHEVEKRLRFLDAQVADYFDELVEKGEGGQYGKRKVL